MSKPEPIWTTEAMGLASYKGPLRTTSNGTTGLTMDGAVNYIDKYDYNAELIPFLRKLNYGTWKEEIYDCDDQALWGLAHLRHMFPGVPAGVASGETAKKGERHALITMWYREKGGKIEQAFYDPRHKDLVKFGKIDSIVAFPPSDKPENTKPVLQSFENEMLVYDRIRNIYSKDEIIGYLEKEVYETKCDDLRYHSTKDENDFNRLWKYSEYDRALWAMVHAHRDFLGCPVGVAKGTMSGDTYPIWVVIVYYKENDDPKKDLIWTYFDTHPETPKEEKEIASDKFTAKMIFM
jgi:hypothetical protein